jgi:hypothetical protein
MEILIHNMSGSSVSLQDCIRDMEGTIIALQATIVQLEYQMNTQQKNQAKETEEAPKSDYDKLKEEIIEEVNLIISDLL